MTQLTDAVVLVVGANGALGSRIATRLEDAGATVVRTSRRGGPGLLAVDLEGDTSEVVPHVLATHGRLDGVVVAAGVVAFGPIAELTDTTLKTLGEVNAWGPIRVIRDALPALTASAVAGGEPFVVTLTGVVSESPMAGLVAYSASKTALAGFVAAAAREVRRTGIRVLDARPGHTETGLASRAIQGVAPTFPQGLNPDDVAARIVRAIIEGEKDLPSSEFLSP